ncbi:Gfo/Idh/MocA family protein [Candidatus Omnitrophota bacterium]
MKKINLGIIGCGYWGPNFVRNFNRIKDVFIKYACDLNPQRLSHIRQLYPCLITTQDHTDILRDEDIDAVVIATPANRHYRLSKEVLLSGKHVLVEKPIAMKIKQARELIVIAKRRKKIIMVGHTFKFNPAVLKLKELIRGGFLGKIYYIYSRRTNLGPLRKDVNALWDLAPHDISIVNFFLGKIPVAVSVQGSRYLAHNLEDVGFISLDYPECVFAHFHVSWLDPKKTREIVVVGSRKMAIFDDLNTQRPISIYDKQVMKKKFRQEYDTFEEFQMIVKDGKVSNPRIKKEEPLQIECRHFIDCIKKKKVPLTDGRDGLDVLKILVAIQESLLKQGRRIRVKGV